MRFRPFSLGKYQFVELLGRGGMAEVYRVKVKGPRGFEKQFAVKRILPGFWTDPSFLKKFEEEARLNSILTHANIVQVFEFLMTDETYMMVMEYVHGKNALDLILKAKHTAKPLPVELGAYILAEVCKGLQYAHTKKDPDTGEPLNIVHRDVTPRNVMISYEGAIKIVDFGIAKVLQEGRAAMTGIHGTVPYMSPEQVFGKSIDHRTDIFSGSLLLFELLTGKRLFSGESDIQTLELVRECKTVSPRSLNPSVPEALDRIVMKGLSREPEGRFATMAEMHGALQRYLVEAAPSFGQANVAALMQEYFADSPELLSGAELEVIPLSIQEEKAMVEGFDQLEGEVPADSVSAGSGNVYVIDEELAPTTRKPVLPAPPPARPVTGKKIAPVSAAPAPAAVEAAPPAPRSRLGWLAASFVVVLLGGAGAYYFLNPGREPASPPPPPVVEAPVPKVPLVEEAPPPAEPPKAAEVVPTPVPAPVAAPVPTIAPPAKPVPTRRTDRRPRRGAEPRVPADVEPSEVHPSKRIFDGGVASFERGRYEEALAAFRRSRGMKSDFLPSWLYELRTLAKLNRADEARQTAESLVKERPELRSLPALKPYLGE